MSLFRIENLNAFYGSAQVLWDVSLELEEGEIVALIGSNGAGKSTLLKTISGLISKKDGDILLKEKSIINYSSMDIVSMGVVHVPEGRRLFSGMSVLDNLLLGAYSRKDKTEINGNLEKVFTYFPKLKERKNQLTGKMSGGEQQMCAIGRGLMTNPKVLLIDELSLGLAPVIIDELIEIINDIRNEGMSIILVEQDVQTGLDMSDRAYVLEHGRICMAGESKDLMNSSKIRESYLGI